MAKISNFSPNTANEELYSVTIASKDPSQIAASILDAARQCVEEKKYELEWLKFESWYNVIESSHIDLFDEVLSGCTEAEAQLLLTGNFVFPESESPTTHENGEYYDIIKPFILAASFCLVEIFQRSISFLSEHELISTGCNGNNVIHIIVLALNQEKKLNKDIDMNAYNCIYKTLMRNLSHQGRLSLLMQANENGFRPLELAAHNGHTAFCMTIFREEGIYRFPQQKRGMLTTVLYDVTDYEAWSNGSRALMSPLRQMMAVHSKLKVGDCRGSTQVNPKDVPVMVKWVQTKFRMNIPLIILKFIFRAILAVTLALTTPGLREVSSGDMTEGSLDICKYMLRNIPSEKIVAFNCAYGVLWLVWELGLISYGLYMIKVKKSHSYACIMKPEMNLEIAFHKLVVCVIVVYTIISYSMTTHVMLMGMIYSIIGTITVLSLTYILQTIPAFGIYVICIIDMMIVLFSFLPIFFLFFGCMSVYFVLTTIGAQICSKYFKDPISILYNTFMIMMNLLEPSDFVTTGTNVPIPLCFLHFLFVLFVPILLLNFLIGLMSNAINTVMAAGDIHFLLNRTQVALAVENECSFLLRKIFAWRAKLFFVSTNGRLYIRCSEVDAFRPETVCNCTH